MRAAIFNAQKPFISRPRRVCVEIRRGLCSRSREGKKTIWLSLPVSSPSTGMSRLWCARVLESSVSRSRLLFLVFTPLSFPSDKPPRLQRRCTRRIHFPSERQFGLGHPESFVLSFLGRIRVCFFFRQAKWSRLVEYTRMARERIRALRGGGGGGCHRWPDI